MTTSSTATPAAASSESPILEYVTMAEAAEELGCGIYPIYKLAHSGHVRAVRYGALKLVSIDDVHTYAAELLAASPAPTEAITALELPLSIINGARGTSHTVQSLAAACGVDLEEATRADVSAMATHIGGVLMVAESA